mmetsp:Transcript_22910/g.66134  ORF Transcript_22910/g.66134 Transcript_22910/m.66134 type:complete len:207 (+) Transcript_22910:58-678(+)
MPSELHPYTASLRLAEGGVSYSFRDGGRRPIQNDGPLGVLDFEERFQWGGLATEYRIFRFGGEVRIFPEDTWRRVDEGKVLEQPIEVGVDSFPAEVEDVILSAADAPARSRHLPQHYGNMDAGYVGFLMSFGAIAAEATIFQDDGPASLDLRVNGLRIGGVLYAHNKPGCRIGPDMGVLPSAIPFKKKHSSSVGADVVGNGAGPDR